MMRLLFAKLIPLGLTGAFLTSSVSPIRPALAAFGAATDALAGRSTDNSGADFEGMLADQLKSSGIPGTGGPAAKPPPPPNAKDQLNDIIAQVKGQTGDVAPGPAKAPKTRTAPSHATAEKAAEAPKGPETKLTSLGK